MADVAAVFEMLDKEGSGYISGAEFQNLQTALVQPLEQHLSAEDIEEITTVVSVLSKQSQVSQQEFSDLVTLVDRKVNNPEQGLPGDDDGEPSTNSASPENYNTKGKKKKISRAARQGTMGASMKLKSLQTIFRQLSDGEEVMPVAALQDFLFKEIIDQGSRKRRSSSDAAREDVKDIIAKTFLAHLKDLEKPGSPTEDGITYSDFVALFGELFARDGKGILLPEAIRVQIKSMQTALEALYDERMGAASDVVHLNKLLEQKQDELQTIVSEADETEMEVSELRATCQELRKDCQALMKAKSLSERQAQEQLQQKAEEMSELANQICELQFSRAKYNAMVEQTEKLREQVAFLEKEERRHLNEKEELSNAFEKEKQDWVQQLNGLKAQGQTSTSPQDESMQSMLAKLMSDNQALREKMEELERSPSRSNPTSPIATEPKKCEECENLKRKLGIEEARNVHSEAQIAELEANVGKLGSENNDLRRQLRDLQAAYDKLMEARTVTGYVPPPPPPVVTIAVDNRISSGPRIASNIEGTSSDEELPEFDDEEMDDTSPSPQSQNTPQSVKGQPREDLPPSYAESVALSPAPTQEDEPGNPFAEPANPPVNTTTPASPSPTSNPAAAGGVVDVAAPTPHDQQQLRSTIPSQPRMMRRKRPHPGLPPPRQQSLNRESIPIAKTASPVDVSSVGGGAPRRESTVRTTATAAAAKPTTASTIPAHEVTEEAIRDSNHLAVGVANTHGKGKSIRWFKTNEKTKGSGTDTEGNVWPWFHGLISRQNAEELIRSQGPQTFLIRVSETQLGYTLTVKTRSKSRPIMHFIIEQNARGEYGLLAWHGQGGLRFMRDPLFPTLGDLVKYFSEHKINPRAGQLLYPCPLRDKRALLELFAEL